MRHSIGMIAGHLPNLQWGGYSYTLKCHCHLAIMEVIYEDNGKIQLSDTL